MPFQGHFDLDIVGALKEQLIAAFESLTPAPLSAVPPFGEAQVSRDIGVYGLLYGGVLVYVGKADNLAKRLSEHAEKINGRQNVSVEDVSFKCLSVNPNWAAYAPESILIDYYSDAGLCEWNGNGFGPHDPGRKREETGKPPEGFDSRFPIRYDLPCPWVLPGDHAVLDLLLIMKENLPFLLRFEVDNSKQYRQGHAEYANRTVHIPAPGMPADEILGAIARSLPNWQATRFPSHMILYRENREYAHGVVIARGA